MQITNIHEAKTHFSKLVDRAFKGEEVVICKSGRPMVKLVKYQRDDKPRKLGCWKGKVRIAEDFDDLPASLAAAFRGESE